MVNLTKSLVRKKKPLRGYRYKYIDMGLYTKKIRVPIRLKKTSSKKTKKVAKSIFKSLTQKERKKLLERARHKCEACGKKLDFLDMHAGHKVSKSNGGGGSLRNRVCLCYTCNNNMGKQNYRQYMKFMGYKIPSYLQKK